MRKTDALEGDPRPGLDRRVAELKGFYKCNDSCDSRASDRGLLLIRRAAPPPHKCPWQLPGPLSRALGVSAR